MDRCPETLQHPATLSWPCPRRPSPRRPCASLVRGDHVHLKVNRIGRLSCGILAGMSCNLRPVCQALYTLPQFDEFPRVLHIGPLHLFIRSLHSQARVEVHSQDRCTSLLLPLRCFLKESQCQAECFFWSTSSLSTYRERRWGSTQFVSMILRFLSSEIEKSRHYACAAELHPSSSAVFRPSPWFSLELPVSGGLGFMGQTRSRRWSTLEALTILMALVQHGTQIQITPNLDCLVGRVSFVQADLFAHDSTDHGAIDFH